MDVDDPKQRDDASHVVVVGAGFGGLNVARKLARDRDASALRVTLVDRHNYHTFQPLLYQVATAGLQPHDIGQGVRQIFGRRRLRRGAPVDFRMGEVTAVDRDRDQLELSDGSTVPYDVLVLAPGSTTADYGIEGVVEHGFPLKALPEALTLRNQMLQQFEIAAKDPSAIDRGAITFTIAGAGPTGVEMAGAIVELLQVLRGDFPHLPLDRARVIVVEMVDAVLPPYSQRMQRYSRESLEERGIEVRLGTAIERVEADRVVLADGSDIPSHTLIWTAGVRANPLADLLGADQTKGGQVVVDDDLRLPGASNVFVIGDMAGVTDESGDPLPQLAPVAIQQGKHVAAQVTRMLQGAAPQPFRYRDRGSMATIGRHDAVVELPLGIKFGGVPAWLAWLFLHLMMLVGFRNRLAVFLNWLWNYVTYDRAARLIVQASRLEEPAHGAGGSGAGEAA